MVLQINLFYRWGLCVVLTWYCLYLLVGSCGGKGISKFNRSIVSLISTDHSGNLTGWDKDGSGTIHLEFWSSVKKQTCK